MKIIDSQTESNKPSVVVLAIDEANAEIFAQKNAAEYDSYFKDLLAGSAVDVSEFYADDLEGDLLAFMIKFD